MTEYAKIEGLDETVRALKALPLELSSQRGGPIRKALYAGAAVIKARVIELAPEDTGNLKGNVIIYLDRNPQATGATERVLVGVRRGSGRYARSRQNRRLRRVGKRFATAGGAYYWLWMEFGAPGRNPPLPAANGGRGFMRVSFEEKKGEALARIVVVLKGGVAAAVERARRAGGVK